VSDNATVLEFGASNLWRGGALVVAVVVAGTALAARQQIAAESRSAISTSGSTSLQLASRGGENDAVRPPEATVISLPIDITVRRVLVSVGDRVSAGQTMVELVDPKAVDLVQLTAEADRAEYQIVQLERTIAGWDESIRSLTLTHANLTAQLANARRDADAIPIGRRPNSLEHAQSAYDGAIALERRVTGEIARGTAELQALEEAQVAVRGAVEELTIAKRSAAAQAAAAAAQVEVAHAEAELALAQQQRARIDAQLAETRLRQRRAESALEAAATAHGAPTVAAPGDGLVAEVMVETGDRVPAGTPLLKLTTVSR
jgi:multidrug resistance efflux pump